MFDEIASILDKLSAIRETVEEGGLIDELIGRATSALDQVIVHLSE